MEEYVIKRRIKHPLLMGSVVFLACIVFTVIYWPIWGLLVDGIATRLAGTGLALADPAVANSYVVAFAEGTFFWMIINGWCWTALVFGLYGKYKRSNLQPYAGLRYLGITMLIGAVAFIVFAGFLGMWWKPFSFSILFTPQTAEQVQLAIMGWNAINFFSLAILICNLPAVAVFHKWPFAGNLKAPWDGFGVFMFGTVAALILWIAMIVPSFMKFSLLGEEIVSQPFGTWPGFVAFAQGFLFMMLIPAEGGEGYPNKLFAKKQPLQAIFGLILAIISGFVLPKIVASIIAPFDLLPGQPVELVTASLILSWVLVMLTWHHLFDDYPGANLVSNTAARVLARVAIFIVVGSIVGVVWLKTFHLLPFGSNDFGLGFPGMGVIAGQFAWIMPVVIVNTFFDKWPFAYRVRKEKPLEGKKVS
ncbi:hypothetical protein [Bacillus sp. B15-48]|uniref:hypothetical protein n=1 Tax=Bacillus sp. B15-48 TaxID=1548601 RepID=UPI00193EDF4F|nr:hypothetical protein [Bacillus sp. B15-48]MBM4764281.1 hypothetical protein [Bacillus sp. B15-48]